MGLSCDVHSGDEVKEPGCMAAYARFVVKRPCGSFWLSLSVTLLLCMVGISISLRDAQAKGQTSILSEQTQYDWTVTGDLVLKQRDMVDDALERRDSLVGETVTVDERSEEASLGYAFQILYYWKDGRNEDIWTAESLQQMCEVENVIYSTPGYEEVCLNASRVPFLKDMPHAGQWLHATRNGTSGAGCSMPHMSAVSLFYQDFEPTQSSLANPIFELFYGTNLAQAPHPAAPRAESSSGASPGATDLVLDGDVHLRNCRLLDAGYVHARRERLYELALSSPQMRAQVGFFLSSHALDDEASPMTVATRSIISLGSPLRNYTDEKDRAEEQAEVLQAFSLRAEQRLFDHFNMKATMFYSAYRDPAETDDLKVTFINFYLYSPTEFGRLANEDFNMVVASILFVGLYIGYHTGSLALALFGLLQIILSLPLALFFYALLRVTWFSQVHILSVFVVLGVGADDIFVFVDAWRQSASMPPPVSVSITSRLTFTQRRAASAIFNTSFTTAIAFFATGVSPIMPLAAFGTFAALAIVMNYALVIFWWPAVMMVWELYLNGSRLCGCCIVCSCCPCKEAEKPREPCCSQAFWTTKPKRNAQPRASKDSDPGSDRVLGRSTSVLPPEESLSITERFFNKVYAPALTWHVGGSKSKLLKPVSIALVLLWGTIGCVLLSQAAQMTPPTKEEVWFPKGHMLERALEEPRENFLAGDDEMYTVGYMYFGLKDLDNSDFDRFDPAKNRGEVIFDEAFDLEDAAAQASFLGFCAALEAADCGLSACSRPPHTLIYEMRCFLRAFALSYGGKENLPTGAAFTAALRTWLMTDPMAWQYESDVGFVDGEVRFARIHFKMTMPRLQPSFKVQPVYDLFQELIKAQLAAAPPTLQTAYAFTGREFVWMRTQLSLVTGVYVGFAICFPVAFLVLLLATGSFRISVFAIATIAFVVSSLLGFVAAFLGWELGTGEAIAATIVIGLSVDYTVHLGHMYVEAELRSREGKLTTAATNMGVTVVAGGVTTLGSAVFMYACQLSFFSKMATLIAGTICFSLVYSLLFFMPLCAVLGPEGEIVGLREQLFRVVKAAKGEQPQRQVEGDAVKAGAEMASTGAVKPQTSAV